MLYLKRLCAGYLRVRLTGYSMERFLNLCMTRKLVIWNLHYEDHACWFLVTVPDFRRMKPLVRKAQVHLKILGRYGLPFFLYRNRKRKPYVIGVVVFFLILFLLSEFIWNIRFEGNERFTDDELTTYLSRQNVHYGMCKRGVDCDRLEDAIRSDYPDITWVSVSISGTQLMVRVRENEEIRELPEEDNMPSDLVSDKNGIITRMIVRSGIAKAELGEEITNGQLLVSGMVPITDDSGEVVSNQYVRADADIVVRTKLSYTERLPLRTEDRSFTGKRRRGLRLQVGSLSFLWMFPGKTQNLWEYQRECRQVVLMEDFYIPVWYETISAREYSYYERDWTEEELEEQKLSINQQKIHNLQKKGVQIIENDVKILDKHSYWEIAGSFVLEEPAGIRQNINQKEEIN
ncbi:MAG: sporulation protein YqfD [Brotaphodocola sp.]